MANYGYIHIADEASRYLDVHDFFRAQGSTPEHKPEVSSSTPILGLPSIGWDGEVIEAPLP